MGIRYFDEWLTIAGMAVIFGGLIASLSLFRHRTHAEPEIVRKLFHAGGGAIALVAPFLFAVRWGPVVLSMGLWGLLIAIRTVRPLRVLAGTILYDVKRDSLGEIYFPPAVAAVFLLAGDNPILYLVPVGILAVADPAAALVGGRYGRVGYTAFHGRKSVEGSCAFFLAATVCALVPLLLMTPLAPPRALAVAVALSVVATVVEGTSSGGLDNLLVPLSSLVALKVLLTLGAQGLAVAAPAAALAGVVAAAAVVRAHRRAAHALEEAVT